MSKKVIPKDVDAYIANSLSGARPILEEIRTIIKSTVPKAEEGISYGVPLFKYHGEFVGLSAHTKHVTFGYGPDVLSAAERQQLEDKGYKVLKGTFQIKFDQKVPVAAIRKIVKTKAKTNEAKAAKK